MKVILYMAITVNGFIAKTNDDTPWSKEEFASYHGFVKKTKNMILGRKTYDLMEKFGDIDSLPGVEVAVITSKKAKEKENVSFHKSFGKAFKHIESKGFKNILISGGAQLNKAALEAGVINEMFIDIEPHIFGKGIPLFTESKKELKLNLIGTKKLNKNTIQLHYKILK